MWKVYRRIQSRNKLAKIKHIKVKITQWSIVQAYLLNTFIYYASTVPLVCSMISEFYHKKYGIDIKAILKIVDILLNQSINSNCNYELLWGFLVM